LIVFVATLFFVLSQNSQTSESFEDLKKDVRILLTVNYKYIRLKYSIRQESKLIENFGTVMLSISAISATLLTLIIAVTAILCRNKENLFELKLIIKHDLSWAAIFTIVLPLIFSLLPNQLFSEIVVVQYALFVLVLVIFVYMMIRQFYKMYYAALSEETSYDFRPNRYHIKPPTDISDMTFMTQPFEVRAFKNKLYPKMRKTYNKNHKCESKMKELFRNEFDIEMDSILDRWLKGDKRANGAKSFRDYSCLPKVLDENRFEKKLSPRIQAPDQVVMICLSWLHQTNKDNEEKTILKSLILLDEYICYILRKKRTILKKFLRFNYYCKSNANVYVLYSDLLFILAEIDSNSLNKGELKKLAEFGRKSSCHITEIYES